METEAACSQCPRHRRGELPRPLPAASCPPPPVFSLHPLWRPTLSQHLLTKAHMSPRIPGRLNDRRTPLGELNWIFTAITDTIAWNVLPRGEAAGPVSMGQAGCGLAAGGHRPME